MSVHYNKAIESDALGSDIERKIVLTKRTLKKLQTFEQLFATSMSGDAEFDVELTVAVNVARAALLRLNAMLGEQSGTLQFDLSNAEGVTVPAYELSL